MLGANAIMYTRHKLPVCSIRCMSGKKRSNAWMKRHVRDPYVRKAQQEGTISRSFYKLQQMDQKHNLLPRGKRMVVVDLGAAPGGWSSYVAEQLSDKSTIVAIDLLPLKAPQVTHVLKGDFRSPQVRQELLSLLHEEMPDLILSDAASNFTGDSRTDALRTMGLCESALELALTLLRRNGAFVAKYFSCADEVELKQHARKYFDEVHVVKPKASRKESAERYLVAKGYRKELT